MPYFRSTPTLNGVTPNAKRPWIGAAWHGRAASCRSRVIWPPAARRTRAIALRLLASDRLTWLGFAPNVADRHCVFPACPYTIRRGHHRVRAGRVSLTRACPAPRPFRPRNLRKAHTSQRSCVDDVRWPFPVGQRADHLGPRRPMPFVQAVGHRMTQTHATVVVALGKLPRRASNWPTRSGFARWAASPASMDL